MMDGRQIPDRVQWHEGMLLAPQHFQQSDQRLEGLVHYHVHGSTPFSWGVRRLRFDPGLLASGMLRVLELEAVLPDGILITDPADAEEALSVNLLEHTGGRPQGVLTVHLVVPARRDIHAPGAGGLARYRSVEGSVVMDENTEDMAIRIPRIRPRAALVVAETAPEKYTSLPIARITFQEETFSLGRFIPPTQTIPAGSPIGIACGKLAARLREGAAYLSEKIQATSDTESSDVVDAMQIRLEKLVVGLPMLEAVLPQDPHPWALYQTVCQLAGRLAGMERGVVPPHFDPYDHHDIDTSFSPVLAFCMRMAEGVQQRYRIVSFTRDAHSFRLPLESAWLGSRTLVLGVAGGKGLSESEVVRWMQEARIGVTSVLASLQERRIRGASRKPVDRDDALGVFPGRGVQLFHVGVDTEFLRPGEVLEILHPSPATEQARPDQIIFYAPGDG
jgi:type VI secretion system protein ImpJ